MKKQQQGLNVPNLDSLKPAKPSSNNSDYVSELCNYIILDIMEENKDFRSPHPQRMRAQGYG